VDLPDAKTGKAKGVLAKPLSAGNSGDLSLANSS
jgi:hypothetical protein